MEKIKRLLVSVSIGPVFKFWGLALCLAALTFSSAACRDMGLGGHEETSSPFSFQATQPPTTQTAAPTTAPTTVPMTQATLPPTTQTTAAQAPSSSESAAVLPSEAPSQEVPADQQPSESVSETMAGEISNLADAPLFVRTGDEDQNEEPKVPMSLPKQNAIRGIAGHKVERFFKTLSTNPVYYHYAVHPGDDHPDDPITEVLIALSGDKSYMRLNTRGSSLALLQIDPSFYYQIDLLGNKYELINGTTYNTELSMYSFEQLENNASHFISTGKGEAVFMGRKVSFEEYTADGSRYIRYYFIGDVLVGHRSFENGKVLQTIEVFEASNRNMEDLFKLPEGLEKPLAGGAEQTTAPQPSSAGGSETP